jgi:hypothetical protein
MSDIDKFFKDKLNEEQSFPRRNRNWKMVSKRLEAFDTGGQIRHTHVRYWQAISVAAAITVGILAWKLVAVQKQNNQLQEQVAVLQDNKPVATGSANDTALATPLHQNGSSQPETPARTNTPKSILPTIAPPTKNIYQNTENQLFENKSTKQTTTRKNDIAVSKTPPAPRQKPGREVSDSPDVLNIKQPAESTAAATQVPAPLPESTQEASGRLQKGDSTAISAAAPQDSTQQAGSIAQQAPAPSATPDSLAAKKDPPAAIEENSIALAALQKDTVSTARVLPLIKPLRTYSRLRAGAQILTGIAVPQEKGVSALTGQGIQAEWRFWRSFSLLAGADWLRFDLNTTKFIQRFHPHHEHPDQHSGPGGQFPQDELVQVESTQRQRQLSLGLRYTLPVHFWVRPSVRVAHNWVRIAPQLISFKFEEPSHGGPHGNPEPHYLVEKTETQRLDKIWRFGAGLERETARWVFNVGADYAKDFSSTNAMFDTMVFRAGLQYKIL